MKKYLIIISTLILVSSQVLFFTCSATNVANSNESIIEQPIEKDTAYNVENGIGFALVALGSCALVITLIKLGAKWKK